jgi:homoserine O-succinyltransferase
LDHTQCARKSHGDFKELSDRCIHIGLINNMPDGALEATERHFLTLLDSAADGIEVRLSLYALPDVPRSEAGLRHVRRLYSGIETLWKSKLDGLIVTGREPRTQNLQDEPYYGNLTKVIEWAGDNTHSAVWSCLAAHAAILHLDGIVRRRGTEKRCGVLECVRMSDDHLMAGVPRNLGMPHSRWNDIEENDLAERGYTVLTRVQGAGVDTFIRKHRNSLFVFFQGHPEYEGDTLLLEYLRDVGRYLRGDSETYPTVPRCYFGQDTVNALAALSETAASNRREQRLADVIAAVGPNRVPNSWHSTANRVYTNWLRYIALRKGRSSRGATGVWGQAEELSLPVS